MQELHRLRLREITLLQLLQFRKSGKEEIMDKKIILVFMVIVIFMSLFLILKNNDSKVINEKIPRKNAQFNEYEIQFEDENFNSFTAVYDKKNNVYKIFNDIGDEICIAVNRDELEQYIDSPNLMFKNYDIE